MAHSSHPIKSPTAAESHSLSLEYAASVERVWTALTAELPQWWDLISTPDGKMKLDLRAGGQLVETSPSGAEVLWYTISEIQPQRALTMWGYMSPPWARPSHSMVQIALEATPSGGTKLTLSEVVMGVPTPGIMKQLNDGWRGTFDGEFRRHCEG
jgi:uncharacterized protein YndB with AHSA1/START domain